MSTPALYKPPCEHANPTKAAERWSLQEALLKGLGVTRTSDLLVPLWSKPFRDILIITELVRDATCKLRRVETIASHVLMFVQAKATVGGGLLLLGTFSCSGSGSVARVTPLLYFFDRNPYWNG